MSTVPAGACSCCTDCWGELEVLGDSDTFVTFPLSLNKQAWCVSDARDLWLPAIARGKNVVVPGIDGRHANPRRPDQTDYALPFIISGVVDIDDTLNDDENQGLVDNIELLNAYVFDPPAPPATGRTWRLTSPDGGTQLEAEVQPPEDGPMLVTRYTNTGLWVGTLHIVVPVPFS